MSIKILPTPIVNNFFPFDPSKDYNVNFIYIGEQHNRIRALIIENLLGNIVYDNTIVRGGTSYLIPRYTLQPGKQYTIQIQVLYASDSDETEKQSELSEPFLFYCFSEPEFSFKEISNNIEYNNSDIMLTLNYFQLENEPLRNFQFQQYDVNNTLINSSDIFYNDNEMSYVFYKMNNDSYYSFRAIGETVHGIKLDTGLIHVHVNYETIPPNNVSLQLENNYCNGYVVVTVNIKDMRYHVNSLDYNFEDEKLILGKDNFVTYFYEYLLKDDFSLFIETTKLPFGTFFSTQNNELTLNLIDICGVMYCKLTLKNSDYNLFIPIEEYVLDDNNMIYIPNKTMLIILKRKDEIYYLDIVYK